MASLSANGNLSYCFVNLNSQCLFHIALDTAVPAGGSLQLFDTASNRALKTVAAADAQLVTSFALTVDSGEYDLVAVVLDNGEKEVLRTSSVHVSVPEGGQFSPRFGILDKVTSIDQYNSAFFKALTTKLSKDGEQFITCPPDASTSDNRKFFYVAWPKELGYGYFRDYTSGSYGFAGSWDGAQEFDDFNFAGPAEVTLEGFDYVIYRNDFPFDSVDYVFSIVYGSSNPGSGVE